MQVKLKEKIVQTPLIEISATEIRRRIGAGLSIQYMLPEAVGEYMRINGLYQV